MHNLFRVRFDHRPVDGRERYDSEPSARHVLLIGKRKVPRHQNVEPALFCGLKKSTILQSGPSEIRCRECMVMRQKGAKVVRDIFV